MLNCNNPKIHRFVVYFLSLLISHTLPLILYAQSSGTGDIPEQPPTSTPTIFDKWDEKLHGVHGEISTDQIQTLSKVPYNTVGAGEFGTSRSKQSEFLEFLKKTEQSTPYASDPVGGAVSSIKELSSSKTSSPSRQEFPQENKININKMSPSELTFYQRNAYKIQKYTGVPSQADGAMEVLSTLQTIQHLINCKEQGSDVRECAKTYILNKAAARSVFELLQLTGTTTFGVVFSLAYADYVAIKNIMKAHEVYSAMWDDHEQALRQQKHNDVSDMVNWSGRIDKLEEITTLFEYQYVSLQEQIADQLLYAWDDSDKKIEIIKKEVKPKLQAALQEYSSQDYANRLMTDCQRTIDENPYGRDESKDCKSVISAAAQFPGTQITIEEAYSSKQFKDHYKKQCLKELLSAWNSCTEKLQNLKEEAANPEDLEKLLILYDQAEQSLTATENHLNEYEKNAKQVVGKLKNLTRFIYSRIDETLWESESRKKQAINLIENLEHRILEYQPKRMRFDSMSTYTTSIQGMRSDLEFMADIPKQIMAARDEQLTALNKVETGEMKSGFEDGCSKADVLADCIDQCDKLDQTYESMLSQENYQSAQTALNNLNNLGCPFSEQRQLQVVAPDLIGKTPTEAKSLIQKHLLQVAFWDNETPDAAEAHQNRIYNQVPGAGAQLSPGDSVDASLYRHNPDAPPTPCVALKEDYKRSVASKTPDFQDGQRIIDKASSLHCYWTEKGRNHLRESISRYENIQKEAARIEQLCKELRVQYKEKIVTESPDFDGGRKVLTQAEQCDWYDQAVSHFDRTVESYNEHLASQQKRCINLAEQFDSAVQTANKTLDSSEVKAILASADNCSWYSKAQAMIPCMDGEYKGLRAFSNYDLEAAENWARWGKSERCSYTDRLISLVQTEKTKRADQEYCQKLSEQAALAAVQADKTLNASEFKTILSSAQGCEWHSKVNAMLPCMEGEYNALKAYNSGDLQNAEYWTKWGQSKNCGYTERLTGLISERAAQVAAAAQNSQQFDQKNKGFWESFGESLAQGLEDYNRQMDAQMQQQTQAYINQAVQQHFQKKSNGSTIPLQPTQKNSNKTVAVSSSRVPTTNTCAQIDSQLLAACKVRNVPLGESLYEQAARKNCNLSSATIRCIDQYIDEWLNSIDLNLGSSNDWKVKKDMRVFK